ncbi:MAG: hypothetical protein ACXWDL_05575 [Nocardioides sp.]
MTHDLDFLVVMPADDRSAAERGGSAQPTPPGAVDAEGRHSGLVFETVRDAWIYCKASKKMVAGNQMLPWLSASTAVISALTGLAVFASLQEDPATWARVTVGCVAILTGTIAALQTWTASRIKALNNQAHKFHEFHRAVMADLEAGTDLTEPGYAQRREIELQGLVAGISEPSKRLWRDSESRVDKEWNMLFPDLALRDGPRQ